ncbi:hypothetical protein HYT01_00580 [Candidatus Giovannonibacteria bacterium]|nr:hypothetical protein [Candidatus Giovannonibacteria bacterium]
MGEFKFEQFQETEKDQDRRYADLEQEEKIEMIKELRKSREMDEGEVREFLSDSDEYVQELKKAVEDEKKDAEATPDPKVKADMLREIAEVEARIAELEEFKTASKDAEKFTVRDLKE